MTVFEAVAFIQMTTSGLWLVGKAYATFAPRLTQAFSFRPMAEAAFQYRATARAPLCRQTQLRPTDDFETNLPAIQD